MEGSQAKEEKRRRGSFSQIWKKRIIGGGRGRKEGDDCETVSLSSSVGGREEHIARKFVRPPLEEAKASPQEERKWLPRDFTHAQ